MKEYKWLPLKQVLKSIPEMEYQKVSKVARGEVQSTQTHEGFIEAYIATRGNKNKMSRRRTGYNDQTWSERRQGFINRHLKQMRNNDTYSSGWKPNGEPTRRHLGLIAWAYSPSPKRLEKWLQLQ